MPSSIRFVIILTVLLIIFRPPAPVELSVQAREGGRRQVAWGVARSAKPQVGVEWNRQAREGGRQRLAPYQTAILSRSYWLPPAFAGLHRAWNRSLGLRSASPRYTPGYLPSPTFAGCEQSENNWELTPETRRYEDSRVSMACVYTIVVYGDDMASLRQATSAALDEVDRIDRLMSNYKKESELSRVNREAAKSPVKVDAELFDFIAECLRYSRESDGAFDITVGPLMKAWGFFRGEGRMPTDAELVEARNHIGYQHVLLNQNDRTIFFDKAGVELDLGGIAKGYAVDRAVAVLKRYGVNSALVSAGGSTIYGLGYPPAKSAWEVKVQDPVDRNKTAMTVQLKDQSLSVSGSYEKFFELGGVRYSHIMDPRTGKPIQGMLSVAVITRDGLSGDALDNVFYVLGVRQSRARLNKFSPSEVIFFLPEPGRPWKMIRMRGSAK
jgi:thiamine biosynthesis lipoprotein